LQFIQGNLALYIKYSVGLETQYPYLIAVLLISTILCMPFWQVIIIKFGKKTAFYAGMWTLMPLLLGFLYADKVPMLSYPLTLLGGIGVSCAYLLPW
jgi:Na+/melibiose symporter-like transporter